MTLYDRDGIIFTHYVIILPEYKKKKKNVHPVHTPAAVDYGTFNFGDFSSSSFVWRVFI
jgi:hypothetical protein